ncbi:hypothetical protein [Ascidiaceihabitans sp.]|uniref:hypothetical protein n=1 Tax=Ascidiaceihabitans sp. TaxID=1872644 RepID=UPI003298E845
MSHSTTSVTVLALTLCAAPAFAGPKTKVSVLFQDFPKGTVCGAEGTRVAPKLSKKRGHPKVDVKKYGDIGTFFCVLPDGRRVVTDVNKRLPEGSKSAGVTVYPNGQTYLTVNAAAGLVQLQFENTLK